MYVETKYIVIISNIITFLMIFKREIMIGKMMEGIKGFRADFSRKEERIKICGDI